ncbi:MAG: class I SAM-dependent methyltransferase [Ilumatobacteraceae bacterium]
MTEDLWETHAGWWIDGFTDGADPGYTEQRSLRSPRRNSPGPGVLDVGCGDGQVSRLAVGLGAETVVGLDPTWNQIAVAHQRGGGTAFLRAGAGSLPFADASFNGRGVPGVPSTSATSTAPIAEVARVRSSPAVASASS